MKDKSFLCFEVFFTILITIVTAICVKDWLYCLCCLCVMIILDVCYYVIYKTNNNKKYTKQKQNDNTQNLMYK